MSLKEKMAVKEVNKRLQESAKMQLYKQERTFRADRLIEAWSRIPELGAGLKQMPIEDARNVAINLDQQTAYMRRMTESQLANSFHNFTPENMLRLVRLSMPNIIRNKLFTEFALESMKDSIKYVRPFWSKTANGHPLNDRSSDYDGFNDTNEPDYDPWEYDLGGEFNGDRYRKALYEGTKDRHYGELANAIVTDASAAGPAPALAAGANEIALIFKKVDTSFAGGISNEAAFESGKWGVNGALYVDGYTTIYGYKQGQDPERIEQQVIAKMIGALAA